MAERTAFVERNTLETQVKVSINLDGTGKARFDIGVPFLDERFELQLGTFEVQEVLDQITRELAPHYYNKAILDVQAHLKDRFESIESDLWALEKS